MHADLSLENLFVADHDPVLVDWAFAARGTPDFDVAAVGIEVVALDPNGFVPVGDACGRVAKVVGWMAQMVQLPPPAWAVDAEAERRAQASVLSTAAPWAARELRLEPPPPNMTKGRPLGGPCWTSMRLAL